VRSLSPSLSSERSACRKVATKCLAQESLIKSSPIPYTIIHATQFFEFLRAIAQFSTHGDTVRLPPVLFQPMAAEDVSTAVAEAALEKPINGMVEFAGPDTFTLDESVRKVLEHDNDARQVLADPAAPYYGVKVSEKMLVPGTGARLGSTSSTSTFDCIDYHKMQHSNHELS